MKLTQVSFSSGEVSGSVAARVDLARYQTALKTCRNFFVLPTGGAANRPGSYFMAATKDSGSKESIIIPFVFSDEQAYLLEVGEEYIRVYSQSTLIDEVVTPYQEADLGNIRFTQSADVLTVVHPAYPPHELRRLNASTFEFVEIEFENGPFLDVNDDETIYVHASAVMGSVTLTATSSIFNANHVGALFRLEERDLSVIEPWEPSKELVSGGASPFGLLRRSDGKVYRCVSNEASGSAGTYTGTIRPNHDKGIAADGDGGTIDTLAERAGVDWEYVHSGFGIVRITGYTSGTQATAQVLVRLPENVVGGATTAQGPWTMTGDGSDVTLSITGATSEDENEYEVTLDGVIQPANTYTVNASTDVLTFYDAPDTGVAVSARQLGQNNRTNVWAFGAWSEDQGYPSVVTYYQDRLVFAATTGRPQTEWASQVGDYHNFGISSPLAADDSIAQTLNARLINVIRELVPLDQLIALTASSAWASPKRGEVWTPEAIGFDQQSYRGCAPIRSVLVDDSAIFVQDKSTKVRDLRYSLEADKFSGAELTVLSRHLFSPSKTIVDIDYATEPHGLLPCVRSDGVIACLTYLREQEVAGWAPWDTLGYYERVCALPEDGRDAIYVIARREIDGETVRFIERFAEREFEDILDAFFVDCGLTYDGRNTTSVTQTLSGGTTWAAGEEITMTASSAVSVTADAFFLDFEDDDGELTRVAVELVSTASTTVRTVRLLADLAEEHRSVATAVWSTAVDTFSNLDHLEGEDVVALADGNVIEGLTVDGGSVTLDQPYAVVHIGLPFVCDLETLDINVVGRESIRDTAKNIPRISVTLQDTRGIQVGSDEDHLEEVINRDTENYDAATQMINGVAKVYAANTWDSKGRIFIRQAKPLPATILAVSPSVELGGNG